MKQFETGKSALPHSSQINYESSDEGKRGGPGTLMKPTSTSKGNGAISLGPSIAMGIWWIPCGVEKRDMEAAKRFFKQAADVVGHAPERVTTDGHDSYPRALCETLGSDMLHQGNRI